LSPWLGREIGQRPVAPFLAIVAMNTKPFAVINSASAPMLTLPMPINIDAQSFRNWSIEFHANPVAACHGLFVVLELVSYDAIS
jgi:hypothetical protein